ncbi:MAG: PD-(D/E)XK nuclease family protein [Erysipelotrichia bacterium]|nr:PD-(D/E)XK nuclease family protein [Erysipelotrichia bacterium]
MNIEQILKDNTLVICPNSQKERILNYLSENKLIFNIKLMTKEEYKKNYLFDYDERAVYYLYSVKHVLPANAKEILDNLYYIDENKQYKSEKLNYLVETKKELIANGLLIYNPLFKKTINNYNIVVYGYGQLDKFYNSIISGKVVPFENKKRAKLPVYRCDTIEDETEYLFTEITKLIEEGTDINDIFIANANKDYIPYFKRYEKYYNIKIQYKEDNSIIGTPIVKQFLDKLQDNSAKDIYDWLIKQNSSCTSALIGILNKYIEYNLSDVKELIKEDLSEINISKPQMHNAVQTADIFDEINDNQHLFLIGFNDNIPTVYKDTEYITDNIRNEVEMSSIYQLNQLSKENTVNWLTQIKNLHLSYKEKSPFTTYKPSFLINDVQYQVKKYLVRDNYSEKLLIRKYGSLLDKFRKYGNQSVKKKVTSYYQKFEQAKYNSYDNQFTGIATVSDLQKKEISLSYSSLSMYFECQFKYYLANVLKINIREDNFAAKLGTVIHSVLDKISSDSFIYGENNENVIDLYHQTVEESGLFDSKDSRSAMFIEVIEDSILPVADFIKEQRKDTFRKNGLRELHEKVIELDNIADNTKFKGIVDKIMYDEDQNRIRLAVIDYKTGNAQVNINEIHYGFSLQLPIYMYLIKKAIELNKIEEFRGKEAVLCGFFIQHVLNPKSRVNDFQKFDDLEWKQLKLDGYFLDNPTTMRNFDHSLSETNTSRYIRSAILTKNDKFRQYGDYDNRRFLNDNDINNIINETAYKIEEAIQDIRNSDFKIEPKKIGGKDRSCTFCPYKDICYKKAENYEYMDGKKEEDEE